MLSGYLYRGRVFSAGYGRNRLQNRAGAAYTKGCLAAIAGWAGGGFLCINGFPQDSFFIIFSMPEPKNCHRWMVMLYLA